MENENVIGKVCFAILRKGFVAGLRISLELDSPGCIIGCKFDGAGIVGNTVIDDSDILLHITSHGIQTEKGHTTGDRSVFYIGVGAALKLSGRRKIENVSRAAGACAHFEPVGCLYITGCFQRKKRCCGNFRIMQRCGRLLCGGTFVVACPRIGRCACKQIGGDGNLYRCGGEIGNCTVAKVCIRTEATALGRVLSALLLGNNQTITQKLLDVLNRRNTEDANGSAIQENLVVELKAPKVVLTKAVLRQIEDYMDYVRKQPLFNSQYRRWKFIAVCSAVDDDVKARYDSQKSKGKKGLVAEIDNYEVYALTWDDVFQSFDLRHAFLLDKLKMDKEAIAAEIAQTAGDEKSKDTADALTALVAN